MSRRLRARRQPASIDGRVEMPALPLARGVRSLKGRAARNRWRGVLCLMLLCIGCAVLYTGCGVREQPDREAASAYSDQGNAAFQSGDMRSAIEQYTEALRLSPNDLVCRQRRGDAYVAERRYREALADYDVAARLAPDLAAVFSNRSVARHGLGQFDEALADCSRAIELRPDFGQAYFNRARAHLALQRYTQAVADYAHAAELDPSLEERSLRGQGNALAAAGDLPSAISAWSQVLERNPRALDVLVSRGQAHARLGDTSAAQTDFESARAIDPVRAEELIRPLHGPMSE